ncbi:MAG TPA: acetate uptake transporter [Frankiaceae bacterium]|nr:acetate uptake transporter [Frankiaceae bacterium]
MESESDAAIYPTENGQSGAARVHDRPDRDIGTDSGTREARRPGDGLDTSAQTVDRSIADPGPLGLAAFALTTFVLSVFNAHIIDNVKLEAVVLPIALFYGGIAQVLAGMWEFKKGNTFGATAFTSFGAFWLSYAAYAKFVLPSIEGQPDAYKATGLFLLAWTIFAALLFTASVRISGALAIVFATATAAFILLTIGQLGQNTSITKLGGIMGLVTAGAAWYTSWAGVLNDAWKRPMLPIFEVKHRRSE